MNSIILIGMPACGKSTVGVILAKTMGKRFIDTDILIQEHQNALLQDIINEKGNDYFQKIEAQILTQIVADNAVISTGGSAIYYDEAMLHLKSIGKIIYLALPLTTIIERLNNITTRGITMAEGETISDLYEKRVPFYEYYADVVIEADKQSVEQVVSEIINTRG